MDMTEKQTHEQRMARKKAVIDERIAKATEERGVLILLKGNGKGKSSSAMGTMARAVGHGKRAAVIQFIKGRSETGELKFFRDHPQIDWHVMGHGFTWETQDRQRDIDAAHQAWEAAKEMITSREYRLVLCDELNIVLRYDYLDIAEVVDFLKNEKPDDVHVVITGRNAKDDLVEIADLVTDMTQVKHPFRSGVKAQAGIEF